MFQLCNILINQQFGTIAMGAELQSNKKTKIHFIMRKQLEFGKSLYVIGNIGPLGYWKIQQALRLSWNKNNFWTGFIELSPNELEKPIEFKYAIASWQNPSSGLIQWEAGSANRLIECPLRLQHIICENSWNMQKITLNLIVPDGSRNQEYFVTGDCKQLGNWKRSIKLKEKTIKNIQNIGNISELSCGKKCIIFSASFEVFRDKSKIRYSYIKKAQEYEIERQPCRRYDLANKSSTHAKCLKISHTNGDTEMFQMCNFQELNYSIITGNIFIGPYLKSPDDFKILHREGVSAIMSIQTSEDVAQHCITEDYLQEQSQKYGMQLFNFSIQDMNRKDFLAKFLGAILMLKRLVEQNKKVYVHCTAGVYRSPQIVSLFLVLTQNLSVEEAINYVKSKHPYARPNYQVISQALVLLFQVKKLMT